MGKHKIETETATLFNAKQLDRQIATTRDTKLCKWLQHVYNDSGYEVELEEDPLDEDEDGGGGNIDEFDRVDIPRVSTACMTRISSRPRRRWTRVTFTNEVV